MPFLSQWNVLFNSKGDEKLVVKTQQPTLGIDYVKASTQNIIITIPPLLKDVKIDPDHSIAQSKKLNICQDLNGLGIAGVVWNGTHAFLLFFQYLENHKYICGKHVLELGAGTGALGLALSLQYHNSKTCLQSLTLTDLSLNIPLLEKNIQKAMEEHQEIQFLIENNRLKLQSLAWGTEFFLNVLDYPISTILCSDCLYEPSIYEKLIQTLYTLAYHEEINIFLAYKQRRIEREKRFFLLATKYFEITIYSKDGITIQDFLHESIYICKLKRKEL